MRKVIAGLLLGLGSFLLVAALTVVLWGADAVKKTPLDTDSVQWLSGGTGGSAPRILDETGVDGTGFRGAKGNRTLGLDSAIVALYQLSYSPNVRGNCIARQR